MMDHDERPSTLDPEVDLVRWERAVERIMTAAGPELQRRDRARGALDVLAAWAGPVFAVAASLVLVASAALLQAGSGVSTDPVASIGELNTVAEAFVGSELAAWIEGGYDLTADELVTAIDEM